MTKKLSMIPRKGLEPYWGVLARDPAYKKFHKPDNFMNLLQVRYQNAEGDQFSARDEAPGKDKPNQPSKDIPVWENNMGRKGVSKRKPKTKSKPDSKAETKGPSISPIQSLVKTTGAIFNRGGTNPAGSNKKNRKGK